MLSCLQLGAWTELLSQFCLYKTLWGIGFMEKGHSSLSWGFVICLMPLSINTWGVTETLAHRDDAILVMTFSGLQSPTITKWPFAHPFTLNCLFIQTLDLDLIPQNILDSHSSFLQMCDFNEPISSREMPWFLLVTKSSKKSTRTFEDFPALSPVAVTAFEWLGSSVLPEVSGEFITPCKAPLTALPWTPVGLLTCNNYQESPG